MLVKLQCSYDWRNNCSKNLYLLVNRLSHRRHLSYLMYPQLFDSQK